MKPMLLTDYPVVKNKYNNQPYLYVQPKLNGWRAMIETKTGKIYSRNGNEIILPHITRDVLKMHNLPEWLDGELYNGGDNNTVNSGIAIQSGDIKFYCFEHGT